MGEITDLQKVRKQNDYTEMALWHLNQARALLNDLVDTIGTLPPHQQYRAALAVWSTVWMITKNVEERQASF